MPDRIKSNTLTVAVPTGYEPLFFATMEMLQGVWEGKGVRRHGSRKSFVEQDICAITREEGHGFARGQAIKKIREAKKLPTEGARKEMLEAASYCIADAIIIGEEIKAQEAAQEENK